MEKLYKNMDKKWHTVLSQWIENFEDLVQKASKNRLRSRATCLEIANMYPNIIVLFRIFEVTLNRLRVDVLWSSSRSSIGLFWPVKMQKRLTVK